MGEFFKTWRRKIGVVVLVLAGFCMAAWLRSYTSTDDVITFTSNYQLYSHNGSVSWNVISADPLAFDLAMSLSGIEITNRLEQPDSESLLAGFSIGLSPRIQWHREFCGFVACEVSTLGRRTLQYWVPYWSFATPLALLSAYLILWNPRRKADSKLSEAVASN
jgi:hypothetical protein